MNVKVKYFGKIAEITKLETETWDLEVPATLAALSALMNEKYPHLRNESYQIAVNQTIVTNDEAIQEGAEVAILPPFAGG
jgi:molybdopterin converting factor subunit 1